MITVKKKYIDRITEAFSLLLKGKKPAPVELPEDYPDNEIRQVVDYINRFIEEYSHTADVVSALSKGDLSFETPKGNILLLQSIKNLQANLKHLTWTTQQMTKGDFSQRIDFMGDFSMAFNRMTVQLENSFLKQQKTNKRLQRRLDEVAKMRRAMLNIMEDLDESKMKAEAATSAKSDFLANMSHELRTPLNAVLGFAQVIAKDKTLSAIHCEHINLIRQSGEILLALINQILDLSKIETGMISLDEKAFDLYRLMDELKNMFCPLAEQKRLDIMFACTPEVPGNIVADKMKLRQVLINLIGNAIKFTEEGSVSVQVEKSTADTDSSSSQFLLRFTITDTGPGISPNEIDQLFKAFTQTETGKKNTQGTGLGLSISQNFVQLMGGEITVNSEPASGTAFSFAIRVHETDSSAVDKKESYHEVYSPDPAGQFNRDDQKKAVAELPVQLVFELKEAATYCEVDAINRIIEDVRKQHADLAEELERLVKEFDFDRILALIEDSLKN